jgi:hypothetical protein
MTLTSIAPLEIVAAASARGARRLNPVHVSHRPWEMMHITARSEADLDDVATEPLAHVVAPRVQKLGAAHGGGHAWHDPLVAEVQVTTLGIVASWSQRSSGARVCQNDDAISIPLLSFQYHNADMRRHQSSGGRMTARIAWWNKAAESSSVWKWAQSVDAAVKRITGQLRSRCSIASRWRTPWLGTHHLRHQEHRVGTVS